MRARALSIITIFFLGGCASPPGQSVRFCENDSYQIDARFEAGNFHSCSIDRIGAATLAIRPEDEPPINESPWYAFRVKTKAPGEVTGAIAMRPFVDTVLGDLPLAKQFRERFMVIVIPLLNPDGVVLGHWRHNVNGVDLNRDWGPFTQPETQGAERLLAELDQAGLKIRLMLDFHSTKSNKFYTQLKDDGTVPEMFATKWLSRSKERLPDFEFEHDARERSEQPNTKNYFFKRYGIPAITYELGDETDRGQIVASAPIFAEEMMRVMLEYTAE